MTERSTTNELPLVSRRKKKTALVTKRQKKIARQDMTTSPCKDLHEKREKARREDKERRNRDKKVKRGKWKVDRVKISNKLSRNIWLCGR